MSVARYISRRCISLSSVASQKNEGPSILRGINLELILQSDEKKPSKKQQQLSSNVKVKPRVTEISGPLLNDIYRDPLLNKKPSHSEISHTNHFFNISRKKLNWIVYKYENIPGEKERLEKEEDLSDEPAPETTPVEEEKTDFVEFADEIPENEQNRRLKVSKKQEAIEQRNNLPEILLLGRCNVGKSSLINSLLNDLTLKKDGFNFAKVKDHPGYTQSLNFFNVGGILRIVDSPGYGEKGKPWQGELTLEYIENRRNLRKVYVLVSLKDGLKTTDDAIVDYLVDHLVPFDFIITKIDKLADRLSKELYIERLNKTLIPQLYIENPTLQPNFHFVNSVVSSHSLTKKTGIDELRVNMLKSCGFDNVINLKPVFTATEKDKNEKAARQVGELDKRFPKKPTSAKPKKNKKR